jgi:solute carrier family 25 uncoupling protein 8/9
LAAAYGIIVKQEGFTALWTGITPNIMRNSVINAAELASYDQVKSSLMVGGHPHKLHPVDDA